MKTQPSCEDAWYTVNMLMSEIKTWIIWKTMDWKMNSVFWLTFSNHHGSLLFFNYHEELSSGSYDIRDGPNHPVFEHVERQHNSRMGLDLRDWLLYVSFLFAYYQHLISSKTPYNKISDELFECAFGRHLLYKGGETVIFKIMYGR